ncbi:MAG: extracellular elastinolytic metalloproteinase [Cryptosporangiaceae bacterium]|nr:extracellular elastinolytic metalloproteinase [Cryptosporangiaceae bacterium]
MRDRKLSVGLGLAVAVIAAGVIPAGAVAAPPPQRPTPSPALADGLPSEYADLDLRPGAAQPSGAQRSLVAGTGVRARFNSLGTPAAISPVKGVLASGLSKDPETAARQYLARNTTLFGPTGTLDRVATLPIGHGSVVLLRQRYGSLPAGYGGQVAVAVRDGSVYHATSSLSPDTSAPKKATISAARALSIALHDAKIAAKDLGVKRIRTVGLPMPGAAPVSAYEVVVASRNAAHPLAYTSYVDGRSGKVLVRENDVDFESDANFADGNPQWKVFPSTPTTLTSDVFRQNWCAQPAPACLRIVSDPATGKPWDVDQATGNPTNTTLGNSAASQTGWGGSFPPLPATPSATRDYIYPYTGQWQASKCDPAALTSPERADADAATTNLFAQHNRMHDWAYHLGFTEAAWNLQTVNPSGQGVGNDAEQGWSQQGAASATIRNNANQLTLPDGVTPVTNMYLWQPQAGLGYPPCVDGDYDMTVIGHEYSHAISNRMIAGPDNGISSFQGGAMGESWSDQLAMEYLYESGYGPIGNTPFVTGGYVTGDRATGIRNYDMSNSPLNFSNIGYDRGPAVHSDGEIWSATNYDIRAAFVARYGSGNRALQEDCANGRVAVDACPGNRRWVQLVLDSFLLQATGDVSMTDMRDNMITADALRFDGANADILWNAFAKRGLGAGAVSGGNDIDPEPSFASPYAQNVEVTFKPLGDGLGKAAKLFVGNFDFGTVPVADTDPATARPDTVLLIPGTYQLLASGPGLGHKRFTFVVRPGGSSIAGTVMPANLASAANGATASGEGNVAALIDDYEVTPWASANTGVAGKTVTVDLPGDQASLVSRVQVSAYASRFRALRSFEVLTCDATKGVDCTQDANYRSVYVSAPDAFPGGAFRPKVPQLGVRSFGVRPTYATHVRLKALTSQCTGNPMYAGEQDNDPRTTTACATSTEGSQVQAAEFQVFSS